MNIDLIISWPTHVDYPLWRQFIHDNRSRFQKVIVIFTRMNAGKDYSQWIKEELNKDGIVSMYNDEVTGNADWRDVAVNKALHLSDSEWIWFTEQDFSPQENFWNSVETLSNTTEVFGFFQETRLHPCCLFMRRDLLNQTSKYFGVVKDRLDHFGQIQEDLDMLHIPMGVIPASYGQHLNGLSQNMYLLQIGQQPNYDPEKFKEYCKKCLDVKIGIHPEIKELLEKYV